MKHAATPGQAADPAIAHRVRLAIDIGGTFTDVVLDVQGRRYTTKVLTTHARPDEGFLQGVEVVLRQASVTPQDVGLIVHGTTLATKALIEDRKRKRMNSSHKCEDS